MAGHDSGSQHQFTGFQKYFNSYTITGRRNYVIATYTSIAMLILYFKLRPKRKLLLWQISKWLLTCLSLQSVSL